MRNQGHPAGSWYAATADPFPEQPALEGEVRADVVAILAPAVAGGTDPQVRVAATGAVAVSFEGHPIPGDDILPGSTLAAGKERLGPGGKHAVR